MEVAETSIVKKNHQIPCIINQKIAQKLIEKISMTDIAHQLSISTSTVIRKLNDFHFEHDFSRLPKIMSWDEYAFTKGKMSFIAQDFNNLNIITVLEGRTQAIIRNHFLRYDRAVRCRVKIITMDMFSPYYDLARQLFPCAKIVLDRFHIVQHLSRAMSRVRVRTQAIIRNHFLRYDRVVRCRVKIITMDMFSPYYDLARQLRFQISRLRLKQSPRLFHSRMLKSFLIAFTLYNILAVL
ncbi:IS1167%2C transposase [Streptococcus pneumoniae]|nr:IS1167%2C transposase [Streptococcus pneumoniae]